jgi:hypothetical protein
MAYILGRSHSGSTILDLILGSSPDIIGVGELVAGLARWPGQCSCGQIVTECPFWSTVVAAVENGGTRPDFLTTRNGIVRQAHIRRFVRTLLARSNTGWLRDTADQDRRFVTAIGRTAGRRWVVDSSKELTRALLLARARPEAVLVHLVRDPAAIWHSYSWRLEAGEGFYFLRRRWPVKGPNRWVASFAALTWTTGNLLAELIGVLARDRMVRVRFEDLLNEPEKTLASIGELMDVELSPQAALVRSGGNISTGHRIEGNRIRTQEQIQIRPAAAARKVEVPWPARWITFPLRKRYGYTGDG